ncbi:putative O-linked N-acetylglucosamine transferase (SPINDLY family) [Neisseria perflava]|uniref:O-linked N-acetylglucosamine transferase, SPINDLY family protein n=1 Tax=Neisseria perflava TaxID=33053 RepID=UPI00209FD529|nr:tetratricopeptide repeat protein [Neisseria perflava]MCP1772798.1 putative O-linked N-acetylglucosamine transferase (SPINDLY family) [Neisseria perflava]
MAKKIQRTLQQKRPAATSSLMSGFLKKAGVEVKAAMSEQDKKLAQAKQDEVLRVEAQRGAQEALALSEQALALYPQHLGLINTTAVLMMKNNRFKDAIATFQTVQGYEKNAAVLTNMGVTYRQMQQYDKAAEVLGKALALQPNHPSALQNMGLVQTDMGNYAESLKYYEKVLKGDPKHIAVTYNMGVTNGKLQDMPESSKWYRKAMELDATHKDALGNWALIQNYMVPYDAERIASETMQFANAFTDAVGTQLPPKKAADPEKKLHIGLVTADLKDVHPVGFFLEGLLTSEAVKQFDWSAYMNGAYDDTLTRQVKPLFKNWYDIEAWTDDKAVEQIRSDGIDILIDLSGFTGKNRAGIFTAQNAPVQLQWLGWFATTGLPYMNGVIADPYCVPEGEEHLYSEKVWRMPHTRLNMKAPKYDVDTAPLPALANGYMTFGCYQNPRKISEDVLHTWAQIAAALPDAKWSFRSSDNAPGKPSQIAFQEKLVSLGFNPDNLIFNNSTSREKYLRSHNKIDLILDTFPYPGGTTTTDALWMAVPTLTLALPGMIGRQGEQLMSAAGSPEFVCRSREEYVEKAVAWSTEKRGELAELRAGMREKVLASPVFESVGFAEDWCKLMREIWRDACQKA